MQIAKTVILMTPHKLEEVVKVSTGNKKSFSTNKKIKLNQKMERKDT